MLSDGTREADMIEKMEPASVSDDLTWRNLRTDIFFSADVELGSQNSFLVGEVLVPSALLGTRASSKQFHLPANCFYRQVGANLELRQNSLRVFIPVAFIEKFTRIEQVVFNL
jgi:hypothetical protein